MPRNTRTYSAKLDREIASAIRSGRGTRGRRAHATIDQQRTRDALLAQEISRVTDKFEHHQGRVERGTADDEDRVAVKLYARILNALRGMESP